MTTTHYSELKLYALSTDGIENASCEFDVQTLSPTYHLLIGIPGKSNAFAISMRIGLDKEIVEEARRGISENTQAFEDVLKDLHDSKRRMEREKSKIGQLKAEAKTLKESLDKEEAKIDERREKILREAREEAAKILAEAKASVDETIRALNRQGKDVRELEKTRTAAREALQKVENAGAKDLSAPKAASNAKPEKLSIGDSVLVIPMNLKGTVSTLPDQKGNFFVQMGIMRSKVNLSDVAKLEEDSISLNGKPVNKKTASSMNFSKSLTISPEIMLIGKTTDEAVSELEKYLDDAYLSHLEQVRIVHGRGTGALKNAVHTLLKKTAYIKSYRLGEFGEGDTGVTIAVFKK